MTNLAHKLAARQAVMFTAGVEQLDDRGAYGTGWLGCSLFGAHRSPVD